MQGTNETQCPACGKLIAFFEKPTDPRRIVAACNCSGTLRSVIETDNPNYVSERDILEPAEPVQKPFVSSERISVRRKPK